MEELTPEVVEAQLPSTKKNLMTVMVLSIALSSEVLGKKLKSGGKLEKGQGNLVVKAIERAIHKAFPDIAPIILGLFGIELLALMPLLNDPDRVIKDMIAEYNTLFMNNVTPSPESNME